jgi:hypothetical protein
MAVFSVFEPPYSDIDLPDRVAKFQFVRDGFSWGAFLFGPLWMLRHRMWLGFLLYVVIVGALLFAAIRLRVPEAAQGGMMFLIAILVGLEAATLRRWKLIGSKWIDHGIVVADDLEIAERRFFDRWFAGGMAPPMQPVTASVHSTTLFASPGIIGSFPEPGGGR